MQMEFWSDKIYIAQIPMWQLRPFKDASCLLRNSTLRPANEFDLKPHVLDEKNGFIYKLWWKKNQISYLLWFNKTSSLWTDFGILGQNLGNFKSQKICICCFYCC